MSDYTDGIAFALAPDVETARKLILEKMGHDIRKSEFDAEPTVVESEAGFYLYGGG